MNADAHELAASSPTPTEPGRMAAETFSQALERARMDSGSRSAIAAFYALCRGLTVSEAAERSSISRQAAHRAVARIRDAAESLEPRGKRIQELTAAIDELRDRVEGIERELRRLSRQTRSRSRADHI